MKVQLKKEAKQFKPFTIEITFDTLNKTEEIKNAFDYFEDLAIENDILDGDEGMVLIKQIKVIIAHELNEIKQ